MKILVTGSSGMIGTSLCEQLMATQHELTGLDKSSNKWDQQINGLTFIRKII